MCLLALYYHVVPTAPVVLLTHRDENYARNSNAPHLQSGSPRVLCGIDRFAGGTWLGANEHGTVVAVTNRKRADTPDRPRSRGLLCRELLALATADQAADRAEEELSSGRYAGANYLCVDASGGSIVCGGDRIERVALSPGLHLLSAGNPNDSADHRQQLARNQLPSATPLSANEFLDQVQAAWSQTPDVALPANMILRGEVYGTVSSTSLAVTDDRTTAIYRYAAGAPDRAAYDDYSPLLRSILI